jgi:hypothetical protein
MLLERALDAAIISAAMMLVMLNKHPGFQIAAILSFYIWMSGQTVPPVSIAGAGAGTDELSLQATKLLLAASHLVSELVLPTVNVYDLLNTHQLWIGPVVAYMSALTLYLALAIDVTNRREFFYGSN